MQRIISHLPTSFDGNPFLYAGALAALMSIACLGLGVCGWMVRDTWRDRFHVHPKSLVFSFRLIFMLIGFTSFIRTFPEVLYLQMYGDPEVSAHTVTIILMWKRSADIISLGFVSTWLLLFVAIYPHTIIALKSGPSRAVQVDILAVWPRIVRPFMLFVCILIVSSLTAYAKVYGG